MICVTRLNGTSFMLNSELIETIEETPDSIITTISGKKLVVKESIEQIVDKMVQYKSRILLASRLPNNK